MESRVILISVSLNITLVFSLVAIFLTRNNLLEPKVVEFWLPAATMVVILSFCWWHLFRFDSFVSRRTRLFRQLQLLELQSQLYEEEPAVSFSFLKSPCPLCLTDVACVDLHLHNLYRTPVPRVFLALFDICVECSYRLEDILHSQRRLWPRKTLDSVYLRFCSIFRK